MRNEIIFFLLALITGALIPIQAATNSVFSKSIGNPYITGLMVFAVGLAGMILFIIISKTAIPAPQQLLSAPLSGYLGGLIVATYVVMITILVPRIGVGPAIGLIVIQCSCSNRQFIQAYGSYLYDHRNILRHEKVKFHS